MTTTKPNDAIIKNIEPNPYIHDFKIYRVIGVLEDNLCIVESDYTNWVTKIQDYTKVGTFYERPFWLRLITLFCIKQYVFIPIERPTNGSN